MEEADQIPIKNIEDMIIQEGFSGYCMFLLAPSPENDTMDIQIASTMPLEYILKSMNLFLSEIISKYPEAEEEIRKNNHMRMSKENPFIKSVSF